MINKQEELRQKERKNRDEFRRLLEDNKATGLLTAMTRWPDYCAKLKNHPVYLAVASNTSGSPSKDLFEVVAEGMKKQYQEDNSDIKDAMELGKLAVTSAWTLDKFKASIGELYDLAATSETNLKLVFEEVIEQVKEKEEKEAKRRERLADDFTAFLYSLKEIVASSEWEDCIPFLKGAEAYRAISDESFCREIFDKYIANLHEKVMENKRKRDEEKVRMAVSTNLLTSIHEEVRMPPVATPTSTPVGTLVVGSSRRSKVVWSREMERKMLDLLLEQVTLGRKTEGGFRKAAWTTIERRFNEELKLNLRRDNFKNKLKKWKSVYRIMKELQNTSGFAWNETTQCMDADDSVWNDLLKRKKFRIAKVYRRQPFTYFNDLAVIVGNDIAEGNEAATPQDHEDGNLFDETAADLDDDEGFNTPVNTAADLDEDFLQSNQSTASTRNNRSTSTSRGPKRRKASMAASLDVISESIRRIEEGMKMPHTIRVDKDDIKTDASNLFAALKAIPGLSRDTMAKASDTFMREPTMTIWFLEMDAEAREDYIKYKFGGL